MLIRANVNLTVLEKSLEEKLARLPKIFSGSNVGQLYLSQESMRILDRAGEIARQQKRRIYFLRTFAFGDFGHSFSRPVFVK